MNVWKLSTLLVCWLAVVACGGGDASDDGLAEGASGAAGSGLVTGTGGATAGGSGGGGGGVSTPCMPGTTQACLGPNGCTGAQICNSEGTGYSPCDCGGGTGGLAPGGSGGVAPGGSGGVAPGGSGGAPLGGEAGVGTGGGGGVEPGPSSLNAIGANGTVGLEWPAVVGATSYNLYWSTDPGVTPATGQLIQDVERGYIDRGVTNGQTYYYVVTAVTGSGESAPSPVASTTPGGEWVLEQLGTGDFYDITTGGRVPTVPVEQRIHVLLFGEGYVAADLYKLHDHTDHFGDRDNDVDRWVDEIFGIEPYSLFLEAFVVWYLPRASNTTIRDPNPDTAFQVPVTGGSGYLSMGSVPRDGVTAQRAWDAIAAHPYPPTEFDGPGYGRARNAIAAFLMFDPDRDRASVSGRAASLENPSNSQQRIAAAFGVGHSHEFTHSFSSLRDEYMENSNSAPTSWGGTSNVVDTNVCSELPWAHLLYGSQINPDVDGLVGAFGHVDRGFHSELLCKMNGTHENGEYFGDTGGGSCTPTSCTLRVEDRFCNFCREITALRLLQRSGILSVEDAGFDTWVADYRRPFYDQYEFQVPGIHYSGLLPQSNDRRNPEDGTQIFQACVP